MEPSWWRNKSRFGQGQRASPRPGLGTRLARMNSKDIYIFYRSLQAHPISQRGYKILGKREQQGK